MKMTSYEPGTPSWVDIGVPDMDAAVAFYGGLFGWTFTEGSEETGGYRMGQVDGVDVAGFGPKMDPGPPFWSTYVATADVEASCAKAVAAGGAIVVEAMDVMDFGRMAVCTDDVGTFFSLWQAGTHSGSGIVNVANTPTWNELNTRKPDEAKAFYPGVFGWAANDMPSPGGTYTEWKLGDRGVAGMRPMGPEMPPMVPNHWLVYFGVADVDASTAKVTELGGSVQMAPFDTPAGRLAIISDPAGATFAFIGVTESTD
ncbi:VOC family protein [Aquihabitans sp. McL0605]|uniref:VOC family protein n=1 Tax=Aquihabitans sp. McL0605 TaxID=3415671 RepID=UPI003CEF6025